MTTLKDLNITHECWQFIISKTYYSLDPDGWITREPNETTIYICNIHNEDGIFDWLLHDIIYQVINSIDLKIEKIKFCIFFTYFYEEKEEYKVFIFDEFDSIETLYLAALQWIWQQEQRQE